MNDKSRSLTFIIVMAAVGSCLAKEVVVGTQNGSLFLDTEVSTNVAFNVGRSDAKIFEVKMELSGSVSNCVQVAFGRDADEDGDLAPDEADFVLGWRGGRYFVEDVAGQCRRFAPEDGFVHFGVRRLLCRYRCAILSLQHELEPCQGDAARGGSCF